MITKSPDTKLLISQEPLNIIICFNYHREALFNALLSAINRPQGNKIPWRYKILNVCTWYWLSWLGKMTKSLFFFSFPFFFFLDLLYKDGAWESITWLSVTRVTVRWCHMTKLHGNCGKKVHRPCSSCISRKINENSIEFSLSTQTRSRPKSSQSKALQVCTFFPYTQSVTGILKEIVLLCTILLQDSSTTSNFCKLIEGTLVISEQWMSLAITLGGYSRRTQWSSSLDCSPTYTTTTVAVP